MKDNSLDGHRGKVAVSDTSRVTTAGSSVKCDLKTSVTTAASDGAATTNFDDDYNEWELGIGDLIIDLDADIEKTNTNHHHHHHQNGTVVGNSPGASTAVSPSSVGAASFAFLGSQSCTPAMSNSKSSRLISGTNNSGSAGSTTGGTSVSANSTGGTAGAVEHQATVDKGLKMKIKRKTVGNKYSEAKHEIVQSDTKSVPAHPLCENMASSNTASGQNSVPSSETKSKHSSSKGRTSSHRDKKEKNRDKDKSANTKAVNSSAEVNGAMSVMSPSLKITNSGVSMSPLTPSSGASTITQNGSIVPSLPQTSTSCRSVPTSSCNSNCSSSSNSSSTSSNSVTSSATAIQEPAQMSCPAPPACSPPMPNLTLKLENKFAAGQPSVVVKQEDRLSPPLKKMRTDDSDKVDTACSPVPPEMKDTSTCTSVGTITEPDCLGPCEPGTSVMLEGIVWQETEGGVLVVNVTWRGKTYVGTLLDCTKHDWAPPRFCESPTSDVDSKTSKGRGKRGRGSNNNAVDVNAYNDARNCVQSKLRNGKGRRTTVNSSNSNSGFTVPSSPAKSDNGVPTNNKRKGRPPEVEVSTPQTDNKSSKRSRSQSRGTPTPSSSISAAEFSQPSSPVLIECPEPNCSKKYKHINGLRYHQTHAHSGLDGSKLEDSNSEDIKDATNSSDNEESIQESMSVPPSPAMSFRNSASPRPTSSRTLQGENTSSLSCSSLPESDPYSLTPDLSTLASVAISDSKAAQKSENVSKATPPPHPATTPELTPDVSSEAVKTPSILPTMTFSASQCPSSPVSVSPAISTESVPSISVPVPAVTTTSVIHSPDSMDVSVVSPSVTVSIPTSHVVLSQGITVGGNSVTTTTHTTSTVVCHSPAAVVSRSNLAPTTTTSFVSVPPLPVTSTTTLCSSPITSVGDKSKVKQDKLEKYKPKSPLATAPAIRPIVPAPSPQLITLSTNIPVSHPNISPGSHNLVTSSLKPIQPKPTILGEPPTISPALESLKKEKSKHKKKSKDKDKEKEKKTSVQMPPASVRHVSSHGGEECEAMDITPYPNLEAVPGTRDSLNATVSLPPASHTSMSPLPNQPKPSDSALDMNVADDNMNENIQSPAYSDISDANDTAPVLESEVPSGKEKEDKVGKSTPDTPQSPAANISAYGMYPYYSQPPYLLPSVSPQNSVPGPQMASVTDKPESSKKLEQDRIKENRPWSNSSGEISRERQSAAEHDPSEKKSMRGEENTPSSSVIPSPSSSATIQDYPMQQHYPYSYGYVQNYQYSVEPSYHMQLLETDPHYKQQYKQYIEEQQRLYKEQHHHHHHQQQQHQQQQQHSHHSHSQQHHSSHQSKSQHHSSSSSSSVKEERREKERPIPEKLSSSGMVMDHSGKQQHSSLSLVVNKEHDAPRDPETRPPSLPAQARVDSSTPSSASAAAALKEKQNENHQILKENIELKSQMDASKNKVNQYEMAMLYERHRDDMRRYYIFQERLMEQQQQQHQQHKVESEQQQQHHHHMSPHPSSLSSSLKSHKDEVVALSSSQSKPNHFTEGSRSSVISPPKSDHIKCSTSQPNSTSSPKTSVREPPVSIPKEYSSSSGITGSSSKKESSSSSKAPVERLDSSVREEKNKSDKSKVEVKVEPEGQKPTMETTGPPPPPTNSYAYLHPSYLPPAPPHFPHMPFEAAHAVYRGGINPMLMSSPHYSSSPYVHQLRYPTPAACDLPAPSQPVDPLGNKLHAPGPGKALDLLHQVSQHYTTHKIHELQEHALMSPTPTSTPSSTPSTSSNAANKVSSTEPVMTVAKVESGATRDSSRSPPTQRHLHTHHHTHVGVGYPIYDPYGVAQQHWKQSQNQRRVPYRFTR